MNIKIININEIDEKKYTEVFNKINDVEKNKLLNMPFERKQHFIAGRYLLMNNQIDISKIYYNKNKKPLIENKFFSISHSDEYTVIVIHDNPVGIDMEKIKNVDLSIKRVFGNDINISDEKFIKEFTKKESYIKLSGLALRNINDCMESAHFIIKKFKDYYITICIND